MINISMAKTVADANRLQTITLDEAIKIIKSDSLKEHTDYLRSEEDKDERSQYKEMYLPFVTFNGEFKQRANNKLKQASGLMVLDYDDTYGTEETDRIRKILENDEFVHIVFKSPSGALKFIIKIPEVKTDARFKKYYFAVKDYFETLGIILDESGKDISRSCFLSYDPDLFINNNSKVFKEKKEIKNDETIKKENKESKGNKYEVEVPETCLLIENFLCKKNVESYNDQIKHTKIDPNVYNYCSQNKKYNLLDEYKTVQGRQDSAFNNAKKMKFNCGSLISFCNGNNNYKEYSKKYCSFCKYKIINSKNENKKESSRKKGSEIEIYSFKELVELDLPPVEFYMNEFIMKNGITLLGGSPGCGKSMFSAFLGLHLSVGIDPFHKGLDDHNQLSFTTEKSKVLYFDEENNLNLVRERLIKLSNYHGIEKNHNLFFCVDKGLNIDERKEELFGIIEKVKPDVVFLDSFVRFFTNGEENNSGDMKKLYNAIKEARNEFGCSFFLLHHLKKGAKLDLDAFRGSGDIVASPDYIWGMGTGPKKLMVQIKHRNRAYPLPKFFIEIGNDEEDNISITYGGIAKIINQAKWEEAKQIMIEIIKERDMTVLISSEMKKEIKSKGFSDDAYKKALKDLVTNKILEKDEEKIGYYYVL